MFHIFGAIAEFERDLLPERTMAGLAAARARGRKGGRPRVMDAKKLARAPTLYAEGSLTVAKIAASLKVSRSSIYRYLGESKTTRPATPTG